MAVRSVQFTTGEQVAEAYDNRQVADFTIWQDKQYLFKYEGGSMDGGAEYLAKLLEMLGNSAAIYTLKVYEDGHEKITDKTAHDGSFNFRFHDAPLYSTPGTQVMNGTGNKQLLEKIEQLELKIENFSVADEGERNDNNVMGVIGQVLEHPAIMPLIPLLAEKLVGFLTSKPPAAPAQLQQPGQVYQHQQPGQVGQLNRVSGVEVSPKKKVEQALTVLDSHVEDLPAVLEKLAWLAVNKKAEFKMALAMLAAMK